MLEIEERSKLKKSITIVLVICIVLTSGINICLYRKLVSMKKSTTDIKTELKNIQSMYKDLSLKIKHCKQNLEDMKKKNTQLSSEVK